MSEVATVTITHSFRKFKDYAYNFYFNEKAIALINSDKIVIVHRRDKILFRRPSFETEKLYTISRRKAIAYCAVAENTDYDISGIYELIESECGDKLFLIKKGN